MKEDDSALLVYLLITGVVYDSECPNTSWSTIKEDDSALLVYLLITGVVYKPECPNTSEMFCDVTLIFIL